ncbi:MAG TPA: two-component regulator propeller domain-containing protein, partial [Flavisolibacter sp.]|nr:two-component regulator propeller domain-containing protein [Flavisolibacter sp.]
MKDKPTGTPLYRFKRCHLYTFFWPVGFLVSCLLIQLPVQGQSPHSNFLPNQYRAVQWTENEGLSLGKKNVMLKDVYGFLWIISPVGLNRFDGSTFKIFYPDKNTPGTIGGAYTFSLVEDSLHNIWIGTNKGVSRYDINTDTFQNFSPRIVSVTSAATVIP